MTLNVIESLLLLLSINSGVYVLLKSFHLSFFFNISIIIMHNINKCVGASLLHGLQSSELRSLV